MVGWDMRNTRLNNTKLKYNTQTTMKVEKDCYPWVEWDRVGAEGGCRWGCYSRGRMEGL